MEATILWGSGIPGLGLGDLGLIYLHHWLAGHERLDQKMQSTVLNTIGYCI